MVSLHLDVHRLRVERSGSEAGELLGELKVLVKKWQGRSLERRAGERPEIRDESQTLVRRQSQRANLRIEVRIRLPAAIVELDDRLERRETAIVHIRRRDRDVPQARGLESAAVFGTLGELEPSGIAAHAHARVVESVVGEQWTRVAAPAIRLAHEELESPAGTGRQRRAIACAESVERARS